MVVVKNGFADFKTTRDLRISPGLRHRNPRKETYAQAKEQVGFASHDRFDSPTEGPVHQERKYNCSDVSFKEGFSKRSCLRHANANLLH
jgi:hypothetical protein